jgi:uncharacterized surface anchored protein
LTYDDGIFAATVQSISETYAPGASNVTLAGTITEIDSSAGTIIVGGVLVDVNASAALPTLEVGDYIFVNGVQPNPNGKILAD